MALAAVLLVDRFETRLDRTVEADLRLRARDVAALVAESRRAGDPPALDRSAGRLVQVLDRRNQVLVASADLGRRSVLTSGQLRAAGGRAVRLESGPEGSVLLLARAAGPDRVVVVGADREGHAEASEALLGVTLVGAPLLLALAVAAGYGVSFFALRPVEAMRRRAARVSATDTALRLPLPPADDELRALGCTLNAMIDRLERALVRERELVADASHELRAPLAVARAEIDLALRPGRSRAQLAEALGSVGEEIDRLQHLCDDLLLLARADRDELPLDPRPVPVRELLRRLGERVRRTAAGRVEVVLGADAGIDVEVDPLRIEQAVSNLVGNSFRYGARSVRLWASTEEAGAVRLHVSDDGPGFSDDFLPRAFNRFARGREGSAPGGSGLGLAIVAAIARAHGGEAGARNLPGGGADVWLALNRSCGRVAAERGRAAAAAGWSPAPPGRPFESANSASTVNDACPIT